MRKLKKKSEIWNIEPSVSKYNWERINYQSEKGDSKKNEKNNLTVVLNVFYAKKEKKNYPAYVSKHNSKWEQVILLMIPNGKKDDIILQSNNYLH